MKRDLLILWLAIAAVSLVLAALLLVLIRQGAGPQIARATHQAAVSCEALRAGAERMVLADLGASSSASQAVLDLALRDRPGTEGGFWRADAGVVAYAFPTYDGTGIKRDPPSAELERIASTAQRALDSASLVSDVRPGLREAVVFSACPVDAKPLGLAAWTLMRVPLIGADVVNPLILAVSLLLCMVIISGAWLGRMLARWRRQSESLQRQLAQSERLATLGRVSAGLAHEIRNPLGTMRMRVENALAAPPEVRDARVAGALETVLEQTGRLDTLVSSLLALTQPFRVERQPTDLRAFLDVQRQRHQAAASAAGVTLGVAVDPALDTMAPACFDPVQMARVFDNLLLNALAHTAAGGTIELGARRTTGGLLLWVADDGVGVPAALRDTLFEAFATERSGGSGLGLALVREIVQAHGGRAALAPSPRGARIELELPWPTS
ncbi:HAMP domain-containing sensor histidine kinase [Zoogloea sp.]|uniref:sensor histidine kinase n=1 Tax=Zoogloea sp. TaxID=49181 RepID=UPI0025F428F8|nr:HAMP domain-containing sensor histidine kinase [Zoogloea sp.]MCK6395246.1 HAMP domain-containing histidine kinase [Zoogloea sp.]